MFAWYWFKIYSTASYALTKRRGKVVPILAWILNKGWKVYHLFCMDVFVLGIWNQSEYNSKRLLNIAINVVLILKRIILKRKMYLERNWYQLLDVLENWTFPFLLEFSNFWCSLILGLNNSPYLSPSSKWSNYQNFGNLCNGAFARSEQFYFIWSKFLQLWISL